MATKEALREFQSRLASRLQAARGAGTAASWLAVESGQQRMLFPLSHAGEIFSWSQVYQVPYVQPWFMGVANLRGALSGVVDMAVFLSGQPRAVARTDADLKQGRMVAFNPLLETNCALWVDRLLGLRTLDAFVESTPAAEGAPVYLGHVYRDAEGAMWQEINMQKLAQHPSFLGIGT